MEEPMNPFDAGADSPMRSTLAVASDEAIVISAKAGMHLADTELCRRHSTSIFRTIFRITRSEEDAEDGLQELLLKAFLHLKKFDGRSKFSTWLTRIAINSALMIVRKKRNYPEISIDNTDHTANGQRWDLPDNSIDVESQCVQSQRTERLRTAVSR